MLDGLLLDQIRGDAAIAGMLTKYRGNPAFFYQQAPSDTDPAWEVPCFPRADYTIDMAHDPERKTAGHMTINVWVSTECLAMPEDIERRLIDLIDGTFYSPQGQATVCAVWRESHAFDSAMPVNRGGETSPEVFGATLTFEILAFPEQLTCDPDPVQGLNSFTKQTMPGMTVIAHDKIPPLWRPTDENPAIYWRFEGIMADDRQSFAVNWYTGEFAAHVITGSVTARNRWMRTLVEQIQLYGEIMLPDESPMFVMQVRVRHTADPLREGQILLVGRYGVLTIPRKIPVAPPLNKVAAAHEHTGLEATAYEQQH